MATMTFDTMRFVKTLEAAGVSNAHAEAFSRAIRDASNEMELATKHDIDSLGKTVEIKIAEMKFELLKWIVGLSLAQFGLLIGVLLKMG